MNDKINGLIYDGKIYIPTDPRSDMPCDECDLRELCDDRDIVDVCTRLYGFNSILKFSQELTDKLNGK